MVRFCARDILYWLHLASVTTHRIIQRYQHSYVEQAWHECLVFVKDMIWVNYESFLCRMRRTMPHFPRNQMIWLLLEQFECFLYWPWEFMSWPLIACLAVNTYRHLELRAPPLFFFWTNLSLSYILGPHDICACGVGSSSSSVFLCACTCSQEARAQEAHTVDDGAQQMREVRVYGVSICCVSCVCRVAKSIWDRDIQVR